MSIREKLKQWKRFAAGATAAVLCAGLLAGCTGKNPAGSSDGTAAQEGPQRYSTIFYDAFDTVTQVIAYCDSEEEFTRQMDALHADLLEYHQLYDIYNDYDGVTNIKTINDNAGTAPVQVDDKILGMLELARQMYNTTDGKLNIAMGSVLRIWHDYREAAGQTETDADNKLPSQEELDAAARHCDINDLVIDEEAKTVYLADPEMSLDVGSVGKGYAVEMVAQAAEARGLTSALISVGGNLRAIGVKPDGSQWSGGVENPWNASEFYTSEFLLCGGGEHERYGACDQRRLPAVLRRGRRALPPSDRPGHPLARRLLQRRQRAGPGLRRGRLPDHRPVLYAAGRGPEARGVPRRRGSPLVHHRMDELVTVQRVEQTTRKSNRKRKSPLRHGSCSNDEEGTFIYYISRIFPRVHSSMQAYLAIRTAPPVTSAVTSSTTQTDATALSRTDSESMTKWNR